MRRDRNYKLYLSYFEKSFDSVENSIKNISGEQFGTLLQKEHLI